MNGDSKAPYRDALLESFAAELTLAAYRVALRNRTLFHAVDRTPRRAIENEHPGCLADEAKRGDRLSVLLDVDQRRGGRLIGIPQVMMNALEVPQILSGIHIQSHDGICVQVGSGTIATPVVAGGRTQLLGNSTQTQCVYSH